MVTGEPPRPTPSTRRPKRFLASLMLRVFSITDPDPSIRGACCVVASGSHPHVLPMYAPVRTLAPPYIRRLLDGQGFQGVTSLSADYRPNCLLFVVSLSNHEFVQIICTIASVAMSR